MASTEQEKVLHEKDLEFAAQVSTKRAAIPLIRQYRQRVENCRNASIIPNIVSYASVLFVGVWLASPYSGTKRYIIMIAFFLLAAAWELTKRYSLMQALDGSYNSDRSYKKAFWIAVPILIAGSMYGSYTGTDKFIKLESGGPTLVHNAKIDSLQAVIAANHKSIAHNNKQTWAGKVVRDARASNKLLTESNVLLEKEIATLSEADRLENKKISAQHDAKLVNFGAIGGTIAGLMDILLLILLWQAEKVETLAEMLLRNGTPKTQHRTPTPSPTGGGNGTGKKKRTERVQERQTAQNGTGTGTARPQGLQVLYRTRPNVDNRSCSECDTDISHRKSTATTCGDACRKARKKRLDTERKAQQRAS